MFDKQKRLNNDTEPVKNIKKVGKKSNIYYEVYDPKNQRKTIIGNILLKVLKKDSKG